MIMKHALVGFGCVIPFMAAAAQADYASTVLSAGAAPYYRLAESSGPVAFDTSAAHLDASYQGPGIQYRQPALIRDERDRAVFLSGLGGIRRPPSIGVTSYSMECWFKSVGRYGARALIARVTGANRWVQMVGIQFDGHVEHYTSDGSIERHVTSTTVVEDNRIYHVVATAQSGGRMHLYINGVEEGGTQPVGGLAAGDHWQIGIEHDPGWGGFQGQIDEVAFYDHELTATEVHQHFVEGTRDDYVALALSDGAQPFYRFNEASGPIAHDASNLHEDAVYDSGAIEFEQPGLLLGDPDFAIRLFGLGAVRRHPNRDPLQYTMEGWFKPSGSSGAKNLIARVNAENIWVQLVGIQSDGRFQHFTWDGMLQRSVDSATHATGGHIYHIAATAQNGGLMRLFVNGVEEGTALRIGTLAAGDHWQIGAISESGWANFDGVVDDVAFYDTALSAEQIQSHYRAGLSGATPLPDRSRTPTLRRSATVTATATLTPTKTPEPAAVQIDLSSSSGLAGQTLTLQVSLHAAGLPTSATANEITYRNDVFDLGPQDCRINPELNKALVVGVLQAQRDRQLTTLRLFVQSTSDALPIPDGLLYSCALRILPTALPNSYQVSNGAPLALGPDGVAHSATIASGAVVRVSLIATCPGDCDEDRVVTINDLIAAVAAAIGSGEVSDCVPGDIDRNGSITVDEIVVAIHAALSGCS